MFNIFNINEINGYYNGNRIIEILSQKTNRSQIDR